MIGDTKRYICYTCGKEKTCTITNNNKSKPDSWWKTVTCPDCIPPQYQTKDDTLAGAIDFQRE